MFEPHDRVLEHHESTASEHSWSTTVLPYFVADALIDALVTVTIRFGTLA